MTDVDAKAFLEQFEASELAARGILIGESRLLNHKSVPPLRTLMAERGVSRLVSTGGWLLGADGAFRNPRAEGVTSGNVDDLPNPGQVFNYQNTTLNPHFAGGQAAAPEDGDELTFALERDLQKALRKNIEQLEPGLRIVDGGTEQTVDAGRIDITAEAPDGAVVVIELKAGRADLRAIGQVLSYMGTVGANRNSVRGILVAGSFEPRAVMAARAVPALQLRAYSFEFAFAEP